jgi:hypothetical protein
MITGLIFLLGGLLLGINGSLSFNFGQMILGWIIAVIGVVVVICSLVGPLP